MKIRIKVEEEKVTYTATLKETAEETHWETITEMTSEPSIIAGALRALANKYDPPQKAHR